MNKPAYQFHVDYNYSLDQLSKDLLSRVSPKTQIYLQVNSECGGNTRVLVYTEDKDDLAAILRMDIAAYKWVDPANVFAYRGEIYEKLFGKDESYRILKPEDRDYDYVKSKELCDELDSHFKVFSYLRGRRYVEFEGISPDGIECSGMLMTTDEGKWMPTSADLCFFSADEITSPGFDVPPGGFDTPEDYFEACKRCGEVFTEIGAVETYYK